MRSRQRTRVPKRAPKPKRVTSGSVRVVVLGVVGGLEKTYVEAPYRGGGPLQVVHGAGALRRRMSGGRTRQQSFLSHIIASRAEKSQRRFSTVGRWGGASPMPATGLASARLVDSVAHCLCDNHWGEAVPTSVCSLGRGGSNLTQFDPWEWSMQFGHFMPVSS